MKYRLRLSSGQEMELFQSDTLRIQTVEGRHPHYLAASETKIAANATEAVSIL